MPHVRGRPPAPLFGRAGTRSSPRKGSAAYQNLCLESQCSGSGLQTRAERLLAEFRLGLYAAGVEAAGATGNGIGLGPRRGAWYERRAVVGSLGSWFRFQLDIGRTVTGLHTQVRADCEV